MLNISKNTLFLTNTWLNRAERQSIPPHLLPWLMATGSLTAKLEALSGQKLQVIPQFEGRRVLSRMEKRQLQLPQASRQSAWVREALLYGQPNQAAWVAARSVFPFTSLVGEAKKLANLGQTPIGYILFARGGAVLASRSITLTEQGWQRNSVYDWQGRKLMISETFLAAFEDYICIKI